MIVHGFPSRLSALQFEWAWQHPHRTRHFRSEDGTPIVSKQSYKYLKGKVLFVDLYLIFLDVY